MLLNALNIIPHSLQISSVQSLSSSSEAETHYTPVPLNIVLKGDCCTNSDHVILGLL